MATQVETFPIEDVRILELLNNPVRLRILHHLKEPATVRDLAARLGVPVTRLYYHLDLLENVGVIEVVETRKSGAMLQRVYRSVATNFTPAPGLLGETGDRERVIEAAIGLVLDGARLDATASLLEHFEITGDPEAIPPRAMGRSVVPMTREGAERVVALIDEIVDEMREREDREGEAYAFSFAFFPMVGPVGGGGL